MTISDLQLWLSMSAVKRRPLVMGILNVTPDSFSDGGKFISRDLAVEHALAMVQDGADLIDIGGESTRPGSLGVDPAEQLQRVLPVIAELHQRLPDFALSIDTTSATVAAAALDAGATIINDVSAGRDDSAMLPLAVERRRPIVLMHRLGTSQTMQDDPHYQDVLEDVAAFLIERRDAALDAGVASENILLDPGIGFGKATQHDVTLLRGVARLCAIGQPLVIGASRKKFIGRLTGESDPARRVFGTAAAVAWSVANGAGVVRVHDVGAMVQTVAVGSQFRKSF